MSAGIELRTCSIRHQPTTKDALNTQWLFSRVLHWHLLLQVWSSNPTRNTYNFPLYKPIFLFVRPRMGLKMSMHLVSYGLQQNNRTLHKKRQRTENVVLLFYRIHSLLQCLTSNQFTSMLYFTVVVGLHHIDDNTPSSLWSTGCCFPSLFLKSLLKLQ